MGWLTRMLLVSNHCYVGDVTTYYDFRYRHYMTRWQDRFKSSAEQQNLFPFFAAITQRVQLTRLWGLHLPPVALSNHNLLIAPSVEFLRVFLCISLSWEPNLRGFRVTDKRLITFSEVHLVGVRSSIRL